VWRRAVGSPTTGTAARLDEIGIAGGGTPRWRVVDKWMLLQFTRAPVCPLSEAKRTWPRDAAMSAMSASDVVDGARSRRRIAVR
jgi:hypothetical protein